MWNISTLVKEEIEELADVFKSKTEWIRLYQEIGNLS